MKSIHFCILVTLFVGIGNLHSQTKTYYYKLTKEKVDGFIQTDVQGGQFFTFTHDACYESDSEGFSVGNGTSNYSRQENGLLVYVGKCYYGQSVIKLKKDFSKINIFNSGNIYVYERTNPPSNQMTCSLIRKKSNTTTPNVNMNTPYYPANVPYNGGYVNTTPMPTTNTNTSTNTQNSVKRYRDCVFCEGGRIEHNDNPVAHFGLEGTWKKCNECGKTYNTSSCNHYHTACSHCRGTGQVLVEQ